MKILVCDFLAVEAHKTMNINIIKALSRMSAVDLISVNDFYLDNEEELEIYGINVLKIQVDRPEKGKFSSRFFSLNLMKSEAEIANSGSYDLVVSLAFETIAMALGIHLYKNVPIAIYHHKNTDELISKLKSLFYGVYKNKVYNLVFEEFIARYLIEYAGVKQERVIVLPHPITTETYEPVVEKYDCVGISNSNSESFIQEIVDHNELYRIYNFQIILRSKMLEVEKSNVRVIKGFLPLKTYNEYISEGKYILVTLPPTFIYRLSGSIYDAIARHKKVITTSRMHAEEYGKKYPGICEYAETSEEIVKVLLENKTVDEKIFEEFIEQHGIEYISKCMLERLTSLN